MLKNVSVRFDPIEDRLVLRFTVQPQGQEPQDHWLHLTRRICAGWRQDLQAMVDLSAQPPERLDPAAKAAVSQGHHQAMASQARTRTEAAPLEADARQPPPDLVTKIVSGRRRSDQRWVIQFERRHQPSIGLVLNSQTFHALVEAVTRRIQVADWSLGSLPVEAKPAAIPGSGGALH